MFILLSSQKKNKLNGQNYKSYILEKGDIIDIISTKKSNYGYLAIEGGFKIQPFSNSYSTLTKSFIGPNSGEKLKKNQTIEFKKNTKSILTNYLIFNFKKSNNIIRVIKGPQMHYFMNKEIKKFFNLDFKISNIADRMGIRLIGNKIHSIKSHNILSEGIIKGSVQVPGDKNPIILMADHPTIGGYPKIATVILTDIAKIAQIRTGKEIKFKEVSIDEAEKIYYDNEKYLKKIFLSIKKI